MDELTQLRHDVIGTVIIGDLNCHHIKWLYHSSGMSTKGRALHRFAMENGLEQMVKAPTRKEYLLDLVLSDLDESVSVRVLPPIADHNVVFANLRFSLDHNEGIPRTVWNYRSADWAGLCTFL